MAIGLHKPGQGYWVRVVGASLMVVVTLAVAGWFWKEGALVAERLPKSGWAITARGLEGVPEVGSPVELLVDTVGGAREAAGTANVVSFDAASGALRVSSPQLKPGAAMGGVRAVRQTLTRGDAGGGEFRAEATAAVALPMFETVYVQGALAGIALVLGAVATYVITGSHRRSVDYLIDTDFEMKKVNWSTRREVIGSTWVIITASALIAGSVFMYDFMFKALFGALGVLSN